MANMVLGINLKAFDNITGPIRKVQRSLEPLRNKLKASGKAATSFGKGLAKILAPLGALSGVVSIAGISALVKNVAELGNKIANTARETGVSTKFLQEFGHVVTACSMESQDFYSAMEKMNGNMGKLRAGTGPLVSGLQKVSPALLKQLKATKSNEEAFDLMIASLRKVTDAEKRAYLATLYFGEAGKKLANIADLSAAELAKLKDEANELGLVFDTKNSEEFSNSMTKLKNVTKGLGITIGNKLMPVIMPLIEKLSEWIAANRELIGTKLEEMVETLSKWLLKIDFDKAFKGLTAVINNAGLFIKVLAGVIIGLKILNIVLYANPIVLLVGALIAYLVALALGVRWVIKNWDKVSAFFKNLWAKISGVFKNAWDNIKQGFAEAKEWIMNLLQPLLDLIDKVKDGVGKIKDIGGKVVNGVKGVGGAIYNGIKNLGGGSAPAMQTVANLSNPLNGASQKAKADITVDFKHVIPGTNIEYTKSGDGVNLTLGTEYGPGLQ